MTCLTNTGYQQGECIRSTAARNIAVTRMVVSALIAADNANTAIENFKKQYRIAKRANAIAKEEQAHLQQTYWPRELSFLEEFANPQDNRDGVEAIESVEVLGRRYAGRLVSAIADRFAKQIHEVMCSAGRYSASAKRKAVQDLMLMKAQAIASARIMGRNIAFAEVQARDELDWNRRKQAISMGKGLAGQAVSLMTNAAKIYGDIGQRALDGFNQAFNQFGNALQTFSYNQQRINGGIAAEGATLFGTANGSTLPYGNNGTVSTSSGAWGAFTPNTGVSTGMNTGSWTNGVSQANSLIDWGAASPNPSGFLSGQYQFTGSEDTQANIGNNSYQDLVRVGQWTFPVQGITGGTVTVDMAKFQLGYADGQDSNYVLTPADVPPSA